MKLSNRLMAVAGFIEKGARVADIGTGDGHLPVYLAQNGLASYIIAADQSPASVETARRSAAKYDVSDEIVFVASPGLSGIRDTDADTIVIAGMGGETILNILSDAPWVKSSGVVLILQPQTKLDKLCTWLGENGFAIYDTALVRDRGRDYTVICTGAHEGNHPGAARHPSVEGNGRSVGQGLCSCRMEPPLPRGEWTESGS